MKDLIILGNGMAGMTAALYAARANLDFKIVGRDEYDFGQIANAVCVENFPTMEPMTGFDLAMKLHDQLENNGIKIEEHEVEAIFPAKRTIRSPRSPFIIKYTDGTQEAAKTIIYALGARHRQLNCEIKGDVVIHYCAVCDGSFYKGKDVAIIGGGDSAFTQAEYLSKICKSVLIIMCDDNITAAPTTVERVKKIPNITIVYNNPITYIEKKSNGQYGLFPFVSGDKDFSAYGFLVEGIFSAIGMVPNTEPLQDDCLGVLTEQGYIDTDENGASNCEGFYAAGDVRDKCLRQAITATADGANAVQGVISYLKTHKE